ncbi:hypothetical protein GWK90_09380 [Candidatus Hamiltonella defensa]|uniref:Uncharacterized protein n=1 Tax=Candidatus Williamhamiltonella defendens TaxID=138072 RepID=A0AAC9VHW0_9ENTR|nr:hypothetical protein [Candidatus Hamiltonella defensa]ASV33308.1 hypothetical protein CJJ18_03645 [Candidatus Hamiltonella defensa]AWK16274.1 hypothetical protein CCS40_03655 [Candidatus Hamiltonella defensa]MBK4362368.1 hypothetical protein [Candidatus Hamiltonella defensa]
MNKSYLFISIFLLMIHIKLQAKDILTPLPSNQPSQESSVIRDDLKIIPMSDIIHAENAKIRWGRCKKLFIIGC